MPSMDIVSEINLEEVKNATDNSTRELATRYDFRGVAASFEWKSPKVTMKGDSEQRLKKWLMYCAGNWLNAMLMQKH